MKLLYLLLCALMLNATPMIYATTENPVSSAKQDQETNNREEKQDEETNNTEEEQAAAKSATQEKKTSSSLLVSVQNTGKAVAIATAAVLVNFFRIHAGHQNLGKCASGKCSNH